MGAGSCAQPGAGQPVVTRVACPTLSSARRLGSLCHRDRCPSLDGCHRADSREASAAVGCASNYRARCGASPSGSWRARSQFFLCAHSHIPLNEVAAWFGRCAHKFVCEHCAVGSRPTQPHPIPRPKRCLTCNLRACGLPHGPRGGCRRSDAARGGASASAALAGTHYNSCRPEPLTAICSSFCCI